MHESEASVALYQIQDEEERRREFLFILLRHWKMLELM